MLKNNTTRSYRKIKIEAKACFDNKSRKITISYTQIQDQVIKKKQRNADDYTKIKGYRLTIRVRGNKK